jgi:hypothetical protein
MKGNWKVIAVFNTSLRAGPHILFNFKFVPPKLLDL